MAKQNTGLMVATYTTDFATTFTNLIVRFSAEAPIPAGIYVARTPGCGNGGLPFTPRYLEATFPTGTYKYVVPATTGILALKDALIAAGATCVDLKGEEWTNVPSSQLNSPPPVFKTTPYLAADITGAGDKETGKYDYVSEVLGTQRLGYAIENTNATLLAAQKTGLLNPVVGGLNSRPSNNPIDPRYFVIEAEVDDGTTISRKVPVSQIGNLATVVDGIADDAYFVRYVGESARRLQDI